MREGWEIKRLDEIASFKRGLTYSKGDTCDQSNKCVLRSNNIDLDSHSLVFDDIACLREDFEIPDEKKPHRGDIFICMSNGSTQHLGKVAYIDNDMDYAFGGFMGAISPSNTICPKYIFYACLSERYRSYLGSIFNGININNLKWSDLGKLTLPVPPLAEQEKIVAELDLLSGVIEKKKQQLQELDNLALAIFYDMFGDPVVNNKGWKTKSFEDCYKLSSGKGLSAKDIIEGCYPVYGGNGIVGYHNCYNLEGEHIIIGRVGALCGNVRCVSGQMFITDNAFILTNKIQNENIFLQMLLSLLNLRQYAREGMQPVITNGVLKQIPIILPPIDLQQQFADKIAAIEQQKSAIKQSLAETETLFNSRMDYYFG